jgi:hypothetical protein
MTHKSSMVPGTGDDLRGTSDDLRKLETQGNRGGVRETPIDIEASGNARYGAANASGNPYSSSFA